MNTNLDQLLQENTKSRLDPATGLGFTESGPAGAPAVVLVHSILTDSRIWAGARAQLERTHRVIAIDLPGHGGVPAAQAEVSLSSLADAIVQLAASLGADRFDFIGVSLGAMIGYDLATRHPGRLDSLLACDAPPRSPDNYPAMWEDRITRAQRDGTATLVDETLARWFTPHTMAQRPGWLDALAGQIAATDAAGFAQCARAISRFDYVEALSCCPVRTTMLAGSADAAIVPAMRDLAPAMPAAAWVEIPQAGHLPHLENAQAFEAALARHFHSS